MAVASCSARENFHNAGLYRQAGFTKVVYEKQVHSKFGSLRFGSDEFGAD
jgi:hypothetical protein